MRLPLVQAPLDDALMESKGFAEVHLAASHGDVERLKTIVDASSVSALGLVIDGIENTRRIAGFVILQKWKGGSFLEAQLMFMESSPMVLLWRVVIVFWWCILPP